MSAPRTTWRGSARLPFAFRAAQLLLRLTELTSRKQGLDYSEKQLKKAVGLGATPNVVPLAQPITNGENRELRVGWHPVGGFAGKWFAKETGLGRLITEKINSYPDPTQHWAVLVGDYAHQLWMVSHRARLACRRLL